MSVPSMEPLVPRPTADAEPLAVVLVTDDARYAERVEARAGDDLEIRRTTSLEAAIPDADAVDCLIVDWTATVAVETESDSKSESKSTAPLERVSQHAPDLPIVLLADGSTERTAAVETARSVRWGECLERTASPAGIDRLTHRIEALVERRRLTALSRRALAGVELAGDAIAIVAPDGAVQFANRSFAMQFGYDRADIRGRSWRTLFTDDSVDRLETTAIPTVADGWRWTGTCTGRRKSGRPVPVRVRLGGPENGGLIFVVELVETDTDLEPDTDDSS